MSALHLKILILLLLFLMALSLFHSLYILFKDNGDPTSRRTFHNLVVRVSLAAALLTAMVYGFYTGKLQSAAPWSVPVDTTQAPDSPPASPPAQ